MKTDDSNASASATPPGRSRTALRVTTVIIVIGWTYLYNVFLKEQNPVRAFFEILDTISDDFVTGTLVTVAVGVGIVLVFSVTKLYTQVVANIHSFRIIEDLVYSDLREGKFKLFWSKVLRFQDQPLPEDCCPQRVASLLFSFSFLYVMSWVYVILFSEALYFVSWSAGVTFDMTPETVVLVPTLALAIPFSARVMAYLRYPYAQDYADFMPGAVFVLLIVASCGLFLGGEQKFFLVQVYENPEFLALFRKNGAFLAFIPVFFEAGFWMLETNRNESRGELSELDVAADAASRDDRERGEDKTHPR